jgi:hypothetical protein
MKTYTIKNIRKGTGDRSHIVYAQLYDEYNDLVISATLSYIMERLKELL